jgi:hypothetical protein
MPKTKIKIKPMIDLKIGILLTIFLLTTASSLWIAKLYFSGIMVTAVTSPPVTDEILGVPLLDFTLLEETGTTVKSRGSIPNLSATFNGNRIYWQTTPTSTPQIDKNIFQQKSGLIGYWKLNNTLDDLSENNITAIPKDRTTSINNFCLNNQGLIRQGCTFGSYLTHNLDISNVGRLIDPKSGSISVWVYPTSLATNRYIIYGWLMNNLLQLDNYRLEWHGNSFKFIRGRSGGIIDIPNIEQNKWYHLVMSWDESNVYSYLNGEFISSTAYISPTNSTNPRFFIGNWQNTTGRPFTGTIDEVAFFNHKLSTEEIKEIYTTTNDVANPKTTSIDNQKYVNMSSIAYNAYGQIRVNPHSEIQKLNLPEKITVSGEIYLTSYPPTHHLFTIYSDTTALGRGNTLAINPQGQAVLYANSGDIRYIFTADNSKIPLNQWVKVTGSFNYITEEMLLTVNEAIYTTDLPGKTRNMSRSFATTPIIGNTNFWRNGLNGYLKNVKVWDKTILNGQYSPNSFNNKIKSGFDRDLKGTARSAWVGSGTIDVISTDYQPDIFSHQTLEDYTDGSYPDGSQWLSKIPLQVISQGRAQANILKQETVAWAAWISPDGIFNLVLNTILNKNEINAINGLLATSEEWKGWSFETDYLANNTYYLGNAENPWVKSNIIRYSRITLGENTYGTTPESHFLNSYNFLKFIKIFDNLKSN